MAGTPVVPQAVNSIKGSEVANIAAADAVPSKVGGCARALLIGAGSASGVVKVDYPDGSTDTLTLSTGIWHPMAVTKVYKTGTTATDIHFGY